MQYTGNGHRAPRNTTGKPCSPETDRDPGATSPFKKLSQSGFHAAAVLGELWLGLVGMQGTLMGNSARPQTLRSVCEWSGWWLCRWYSWGQETGADQKSVAAPFLPVTFNFLTEFLPSFLEGDLHSAYLWGTLHYCGLPMKFYQHNWWRHLFCYFLSPTRVLSGS